MPQQLVEDLVRELDRARLRSQNGIKLLAGLEAPPSGATAKDQVWGRGKVRLYRYRSEGPRRGPPLLLFIGLMSRPYFLDLHRGASFVARLLESGFDVFLLDWGVPDEAEGDHTLDTYVDYYLPRAIAATRRTCGSTEVTIVGYCMGAFLALLLLGSRRDLPIRAFVAITPLLDMAHLSRSAEPLRTEIIDPVSLIDETTQLVPAALIKSFFKLRKPTADAVQYANLWQNLWREDYVRGHQAMAQWVWDHVPFAGPAFLQMTRDYVQANALMTGQARIGGRAVRLGSITEPTLVMTAERDELVPPACSAPLAAMMTAADVTAHAVPAGHIGLIMGRSGAKVSIPLMLDWLERHSIREEA